MKHEYRTHTGEPFAIVTVQRDGIVCRFCGRIVRVRELVAYFAKQEVGHKHECRDCLYAAPLTEHNRWRKDHPEHDRA